MCFFLVGAVSVDAQAKKCSKGEKSKCCAKKAAKAEAAGTEATATMASFIEEADKLAEADENIEKRVNSETGETSYFAKYTCEESGKVSWNEVEYCSKSQKFTKVASASMEREGAATAKKACSKDKKACCSSKEKKACAKDKKACSKSKKACAKDKAKCNKSKASCASKKAEKEAEKMEEKQ